MRHSHGRDPWKGSEDTRQAALRLAAHPELGTVAAASGLFTGADTLSGDINLLPPGLNAYMSYVDGFGGFGELEARFAGTGAVLISISVQNNPAVVADVEPGAMVPSDFPAWYDTKADRSLGLPWGYASASNMQALIDAAAGRPFIRWSAHYGQGAHICGPGTCGFPQADWTQWDDKGPLGQNFDRSIGRLLPGHHPKPPKPEDIMAIAAAELNGVPHVFYEAKDGSVWYTTQPAHGHAWKGGVQGQHVAGLAPFAPAPK